jgi:hypothetical protein
MAEAKYASISQGVQAASSSRVIQGKQSQLLSLSNYGVYFNLTIIVKENEPVLLLYHGIANFYAQLSYI